MPFEPGQSGNPNGARKPRAFAEELRMALKATDASDRNGLRRIADALIAKAAEGDVPAIKEVADRIDGKVAQALTGDDGEPLTIQIIRFSGNTPASG